MVKTKQETQENGVASLIDAATKEALQQKQNELATAIRVAADALRKAAEACESYTFALPLPPAPGSDDKANGKKRKRERDPDQPKRPMSAYLIYQGEVRQQVKDKLGEQATQQNIMKEVAERWGKLTDAQKKKYVDLAEKAKEQYTSNMEEYKAKKDGGESPAAASAPEKEASPEPEAEAAPEPEATPATPAKAAATPKEKKNKRKSRSDVKTPSKEEKTAESAKKTETPAPAKTPKEEKRERRKRRKSEK
ncbi:hypothetical protein YB2330_005221 [Saitoella coloradoensis]